MFVHFGLYSQLGRGEWVMNREQIPPREMHENALHFNPSNFDANELCELAVSGGMKYIVFTTMHHDGFRMYGTALSQHNSNECCGRDFVKEIVEAARAHNLKIGLYHSLNNWYDQPDAVAALESQSDYDVFIQNTFMRLKELLTLFNPIDIMWYDGWWPFDSAKWKALEMNQELRKIQPHLIFNGRNGLPGDFGTPENHITAPRPWRPWEACMTLNNHWGFHRSDKNWKSPVEVIGMLMKCAVGNGNLLLNVGPDGTGAIPLESSRIIRKVGKWIQDGGDELLAQGIESLPYAYGFRENGDRGDWDAAGPFYARGNVLYQIMFYPPEGRHILTGVESKVRSVSSKRLGELPFRQEEGRLEINIPDSFYEAFAPVLRIECDGAPSIYRTGGMRVPKCQHPRYDPVQPDIDYNA